MSKYTDEVARRKFTWEDGDVVFYNADGTPKETSAPKPKTTKNLKSVKKPKTPRK